MVFCRKKYYNFISDVVFIAIVCGRLRPVRPGSQIFSLRPVDTLSVYRVIHLRYKFKRLSLEVYGDYYSMY